MPQGRLPGMTGMHETYYRAMCSRDSRFDGVFFVGVTTTRIYCRPVCSARTPRPERCRFFDDPAEAEKAGFRPCLRCRPELAPGRAPVDSVRTLARCAAERIQQGALAHGQGLESLAQRLGTSSRQLRRAMRAEFGVSPIELAQTRRLLLAKQLLTETELPILQVAFASGFESARRFNALFRNRYGLAPSRMRRTTGQASCGDSLRLMQTYRPPYAWKPLLRFLAARAIPGVESVEASAYCRTVSLDGHAGWLRIWPLAGRDALGVELSSSLTPALPQLLGRLRRLFDLDARPDVIATHLAGDRRLRDRVTGLPGLRLPGALDEFEGAVRAILGQRVSVAAATTIAGRLAALAGRPISTPLKSLSRLTPTPADILTLNDDAISGIGIPRSRVAAIKALALALASGKLDLAPGPMPEATIEALTHLPGIGPWSAHYIGMRVLHWPDAFPDGDLILQRVADTTSAGELRRKAAQWRPWRAYAAMYLWEEAIHKREATHA